LGVTGHRDMRANERRGVAKSMDDLLRRLAELSAQVHAENRDVLRAGGPKLSLLSQLAAGADQMASRLALARGYRLRAVLPFDPQTYRRDFKRADAVRFDELLENAQCWGVPRQEGPRELAYALAGQAMVAQCDVLLAVWDGQPARGPGGTAEVVGDGLRKGLPVIHIPSDGVGEVVVLWAGFDGLAPDRLDLESTPRRPASDLVLQELMQALLAPPKASQESVALSQFLRERMRRLRFRPEYPLLLAAMGVRSIQRRNFIQEDYLAATAREWASFRAQPTIAGEAMSEALAVLQPAFAWADGLADHAAQTYRSGLVFNYAAAALSVLLALSSFLPGVPIGKVWLQLSELALIGLLIANTTIGSRLAWHRRWLDYRYLAEQLRPLRSLKALGAATPPRHSPAAGTGRWSEWYARAIWREMGVPPTIPDQKAVAALVRHISDEEVAPQVSYNGLNAACMHHLDHRLHLIGTGLFYATAAIGVVTLAGLAAGLSPPRLLTALSAGLPTIGAALFGIRGQGDFVGASGRSAETETKLKRAVSRMATLPGNVTLACRTTEDAAATMLADLGEWRATYRHRKLAIPA
jgi:hypothetical protein